MVRLNRIYTRTGDDGTSGLVDGSRLPKYAPRFEAIGAVDEANSVLGWASVRAVRSPTGRALDRRPDRIQNDLFDLGADLATPGDDFTPSEMVLRIVPAQVEWLEQRIDRVNETLIPLRSFILPGAASGRAAAHRPRHCPPAERAMTWLAAEEPVNPGCAGLSTGCRTICSCWRARSMATGPATCSGHRARIVRSPGPQTKPPSVHRHPETSSG
jgi:cob(I)alamin adenosyltransferase